MQQSFDLQNNNQYASTINSPQSNYRHSPSRYEEFINSNVDVQTSGSIFNHRRKKPISLIKAEGNQDFIGRSSFGVEKNSQRKLPEYNSQVTMSSKLV